MSDISLPKQTLRVLHVLGALNMGGAESRTVELYRAIDRSRVQFDFLVHTDARGGDRADTSSEALMATRAPQHFDDIVRESGARVFAVPRFHGTNYAAYRKALRSFFGSHRGDWVAVHGHMTSTASVYLPIAGEEGGVPLLIAHARSAGVDPGIKGIVTNLLRKPLRKTDCPYVRLAVSETAGEAVFGKAAMRDGHVHVVPNAVRLECFSYDAKVRERIRRAHGIPEDAFVIGHVGSFRFAKNHEFLLRVFAAWKAGYGDIANGSGQQMSAGAKDVAEQKCKLLLAGDGERLPEIRAMAEAEGIAGDVIFAGNRSDIAAYYSAMDILVFPSRYEGMPGTVIEAQAAGLPCLISDTITKEAVLTEQVRRMSIQAAPGKWAEAVGEMCAPVLTGNVSARTEASAGGGEGRAETSARARQ
ncbi:MAG: glycosyltransferase, partial [Lachnospiraceae bacterium]|nr:glycosyltransferase [Lachnospiraceae bacterium]